MRRTVTVPALPAQDYTPTMPAFAPAIGRAAQPFKLPSPTAVSLPTVAPSSPISTTCREEFMTCDLRFMIDQAIHNSRRGLKLARGGLCRALTCSQRHDYA